MTMKELFDIRKLKPLAINEDDLKHLFNDDEMEPIEDLELKPLDVDLKPLAVDLEPAEEIKLKPLKVHLEPFDDDIK